MSVAILLDELDARRITVTVEGGNLRLRGSPGSWHDLLDRLRAVKAELIAVLSAHGMWDAADWRDYFEERAAIAEYDGSLPRQDAERLAHLYCGLEWSNRNPPPDPGVGQCAHCRQPLGDEVTTISTTAGTRHLHVICCNAYAHDRARTASAHLASVGIAGPSDV